MEAHGHSLNPDAENFAQTPPGCIELNFAWKFVPALVAGL